ncbi:Fur-regulated basic protein FbpA [Bacillus sp. FJAT-22090]|uniref:Fur-regulated basic protein FbpA n=1 Tax=Bacillus sp. FJAT-22090 TaxID=1581038 RepID=UPI0011A9B0AA|nr:Fur-regulated basic protein FbpA [Bacillus sp. FJAT-22090]
MIIQYKESKMEEKRDHMIEDLVKKGIFKIDGRQLYQLNYYELMKEYIAEEEERKKVPN